MSYQRLKYIFILSIVFAFPKNSLSIPIYEYEISIQAQTSADVGAINIQGSITNTGNVALTTQWVGTSAPSNVQITACGAECLYFDQLLGVVIEPNETFDISWLSGFQLEDPNILNGRFFEGAIGMVPVNSDWNWMLVDLNPFKVSSEFILGDIDIDLPWNSFIVNSENTIGYIEGTKLVDVPEPDTFTLLLTSLLILIFTKWGPQIKDNKRGSEATAPAIAPYLHPCKNNRGQKIIGVQNNRGLK